VDHESLRQLSQGRRHLFPPGDRSANHAQTYARLVSEFQSLPDVDCDNFVGWRYLEWKYSQFDCPDVAILVDRMPVFVGFAFLKVHRLFTNSAVWFVGHGASWERLSYGSLLV